MIAPLYVVQELSARCYAGCEGCFRSFIKGPLNGDMPPEVFEAACRGVPPGTMILPAFHGESLNHPAFEGYLKRYKDLGLRVSLPTSGSAGFRLIPSLVEEETPVYILIMSVDGYCEYSHNTRRGNITLQRVEAFVDECIRLRGSRPQPWLAVRMVENNQSELELELYLKKWLFEKKLDFVLHSRMFSYGSKLNSPTSLTPQRCRSLIEGNPVVLFNGDVLLCERTPDREKYVIGNVLRDDWDTILARRQTLVGDYPHREPCRLCSAAYLLTGFKGVMQFKHPSPGQEDVPIYTHRDHSQTYYSLTRNWQGINWRLQ